MNGRDLILDVDQAEAMVLSLPPVNWTSLNLPTRFKLISAKANSSRLRESIIGQIGRLSVEKPPDLPMINSGGSSAMEGSRCG